MDSMDSIRAACERTASALAARPALGQQTFVTRVRVHDGLAYAHFDTPTRQDARAEYLAAIAPYRQGSGYAIPGEFVMTSGRKL